MKRILSLILVLFFTVLLIAPSFTPVAPGSKVPAYPVLTNLTDAYWFVVSPIVGPTRSLNAGVLRSNILGSAVTNSFFDILTTSNGLYAIIGSTNAALLTTIITSSNYLYGLIGTNVTVAAGTNVTVTTNTHGIQTVYTVGGKPGEVTTATLNVVSNFLYSLSTSDMNWSNSIGVLIQTTNIPIALGTNAIGMPSRLYIQDQITNDSLSSVYVRMIPRAGTGNNRNGFCVEMTRGDEVGSYSHGLYSLNEATTSNYFGAYYGNVPFALIGTAQSAGPGDSVGVIGVNLGTNKTRYGVVGIASGANTGNTNVGVFGHGDTNSSLATGVYAELGAGTATATDAKYPRTAAAILNNRQTALPLLLAFTNSNYEVLSLLANGHLWLNSNDLFSIKAGANVTLITNGTDLTIASASSVNALNGSFDNVIVTNGINRIRSIIPSTTTTQQIDCCTGPTAYYMTNMVTNILINLTNTWCGSVSNRVLDFFFTGSTNTGPNYTVTFACPSPSSLVIRWGTYSVTNGGNSFAVTNNSGAGASLTLWDTNLVEAYYSPTR